MRRAAWLGLILTITALSHGLSAESADKPFPVVAPAWTLRFEQSVRWHRVHPMGPLVVATDCCLQGIDPAKGTIAWTRGDLVLVDESSFEPIFGTTLFAVSSGKLRNRTVVLDALDGDVVFDSQAAGIVNILQRTVLFETGGLLILGQEQGDPTIKLFLAEMETGKVRWTNNDIVPGSAGIKKLAGIMATLMQPSLVAADPAQAPRPLEVGPDAVVLASSGEIIKLSAATGKFAWRVPNRDGDGRTELFVPESRPDMLIVGTEIASATADGSTAPSHSLYSAYRLADGARVWPKAIKVKGAINTPVQLQDGALLSAGGGADDGIRFVEYDTGRSVWGKNGKGIESDGGIVDYAATDLGLVLTTGRDSLWTNKGIVYSMNLLDPLAGAFRFPKSLRTKGRLLRTEVVPKGVLYVTTHEVNVFDPRTGVSALGQAIVSESLVTADAGSTLYVFAPEEGALWSVDKREARATRLGSEHVKLEDGDLPRSLEATADRVTLLGSQSVIGFDLQGKVLFNAHIPAPRNPAWVRALAIAQSIRMGMAAAEAGMASAALSQYAAQQENGTLERGIADEFARGYGQISEAAADASTAYARLARQRFKASAASRDFQFMMIQAQRGFGIAQVAKADGAVRGLIVIGKDKTPSYEVDDVARRVYYRPDERQILGYAF